jgi:hypothetical protein
MQNRPVAHLLRLLVAEKMSDAACPYIVLDSFSTVCQLAISGLRLILDAWNFRPACASFFSRDREANELARSWRELAME